MNTSGNDMPNHMVRRASMVVKGTWGGGGGSWDRMVSDGREKEEMEEERREEERRGERKRVRQVHNRK